MSYGRTFERNYASGQPQGLGLSLAIMGAAALVGWPVLVGYWMIVADYPVGNAIALILVAPIVAAIFVPIVAWIRDSRAGGTTPEGAAPFMMALLFPSLFSLSWALFGVLFLFVFFVKAPTPNLADAAVPLTLMVGSHMMILAARLTAPSIDQASDQASDQAFVDWVYATMAMAVSFFVVLAGAVAFGAQGPFPNISAELHRLTYWTPAALSVLASLCLALAAELRTGWFRLFVRE